MNRIRSTVAALIVSVAPMGALAYYEVDCRAENQETGAEVVGTCTDEWFSGEDSETGASVSGDCEIGDYVQATDEDTEEEVSGWCEDR